MPVNELQIDGETAWRMDHDLPPLWAWLFDPRSITESRRLHNTLFDAATRFQANAARAAQIDAWAPYLSIFEEIRPEEFSRVLGKPPDAILRLDLAALEGSRPYRHEQAAREWDRFFAAAESGDRATARDAWEEAVLSPLSFTGGRQRDARALALLARGFGLPENRRAEALAWSLFGRPATRRAELLTAAWIERANELSSVGYTRKLPWWRKLFL